ncbi:MAG TPA: hypothetical protein VK489_10910 [Ferruginibacter sp.]|nr:hypothetical protein [Ferruginibacter sp.]
MTRVLKFSLFLTYPLISGCLFSSDDVKDHHVVGSFYVSSFADKNSLLYKNKNDLKLKGSGSVILENIDSVGWHLSNILAVFNKQYFLIDSTSHKIKEQYKSYEDLIIFRGDLNTTKFNLQRVTIK